jgi:hypothetical protein
MSGEVELYTGPKPADEPRSFPEKVQSLDDDRPLVELAFDHIHHMDNPYGENNPPLPTQFVRGFLVAATGEAKAAYHCDQAYTLARCFYAYAEGLRHEAALGHNNEETGLLLKEINRRVDIWYTAINEHIKTVPGAKKKLNDEYVRLGRSKRRSAA